MSEHAYIVNGVTAGDEGKGSTVFFICKTFPQVHTVIKMGGFHGAHNVDLPDGRRFLHQSFGSGTFAGARTHIPASFVLGPLSLYNEAEALKEAGIRNPFSLLTIDSSALIATPFHKALSRLEELKRAVPYSSVGVGVGKTIELSESHPEFAIRAADLLAGSALEDKLWEVRRLCRELAGDFPSDVSDLIAEELNRLTSDDIFRNTVDWFRNIGGQIRIVGPDYTEYLLNKKAGDIVFETSQAALLDRWHGFHPYTTKVRTVPEPAMRLLSDFGFQGERVLLGLTRAYQIRHGAGPFVSEDPELSVSLTDRDNGDHPWQGKFRVGWLDLISLDYAFSCCGGTTSFDGLAVSCLDRLPPQAKLCEAYRYIGNAYSTRLDEFFYHSGYYIYGIKARPVTFDKDHLCHQEELGKLLLDCRPVLVDTTGDGILNRLEERFDIPIAIRSYGPQWTDKTVGPIRPR